MDFSFLFSISTLVGFFSGFLGGGFVWFLVSYIIRSSRIKSNIQREVQNAKKKSSLFFDQVKETIEKYREEIKLQSEREEENLKYAIDQLKNTIHEKEKDTHEIFNQRKAFLTKKHDFLNRYGENVLAFQKKLDEVKKREKEFKKKLISQLEKKAQLGRTQILSDLKEKKIQSVKNHMGQWSKVYIDEIQSDSEKISKNILNQILHRFMNPSCHERGLKPVQIKTKRDKVIIMGQSEDFLPILEELCGVDMIYNLKGNLISITGFDPVRRELGRLVLEKLIKEKKVFQNKISFTRHAQGVLLRVKKEFLKRIWRDGEFVAKKLKFSDLHENIKNMLGALRYRYSFTQNQYFHCLEVGFLCGLLSSELGLSHEKGRRAGLLHDIGKSMDHSVDEGHAVIGADFIKKNGEEEDIVHAVRAHHYDEHPRTELAYLVIAADALSGARPGARHSTLEVYTQKVDQLQTIGNSFDGVLDTYVLSAGREVRVFVDSKKVADSDAIQLSQKIARDIEQKCVYPGKIKVTVVRKTESMEAVQGR